MVLDMFRAKQLTFVRMVFARMDVMRVSVNEQLKQNFQVLENLVRASFIDMEEFDAIIDDILDFLNVDEYRKQ